MYQSVLAKRQGSGSSGVGFAFKLVDVKELSPDKNICYVSDVQTGESIQVGLNKRGTDSWPRTGDRWLIDRSTGVWMLQCKITSPTAPVITGSAAEMEPGLLQLVSTLEGLGLLQDQTTPGVVPTVSGSKNILSPTTQQILSILDTRGILVDNTTAQTLPVGVWQVPTLTSPFSDFNSVTHQTTRYMIDTQGFVTIEGLVKTSTSVSGTVPVFVLPSSDWWPKKLQVFCAFRNGSIAQQLEVTTAGVVELFGISPAATLGYVTLACRFSTAP